MASVRGSELDAGRRPWWWEPWCSWAGLAAQVLVDRHDREDGMVAGNRRSVVVVRQLCYTTFRVAKLLVGVKTLPGSGQADCVGVRGRHLLL